MGTSNRERIDAIERDLISGVPLTNCLRAMIALALALSATDLRTWAEQELNGYALLADVPDYRRVPTAVVADLRIANKGVLRNQPVPARGLPDAYHDVIERGLPLQLGVTELSHQLDRLGRVHEPLRLSIGDAPQLTLHINEAGIRDLRTRYLDVRYQMTEAVVRSMVDRIRDRAIHVLHDIRALTNPDAEPAAQAANQAVNVINQGNNNQFTVTASQAGHGDATSTHTASAGDSGLAHEALLWTKRQTRWTIFGGIIAVIGLLLAAYLGWDGLTGG